MTLMIHNSHPLSYTHSHADSEREARAARAPMAAGVVGITLVRAVLKLPTNSSTFQSITPYTLHHHPVQSLVRAGTASPVKEDTTMMTTITANPAKAGMEMITTTVLANPARARTVRANPARARTVRASLVNRALTGKHPG